MWYPADVPAPAAEPVTRAEAKAQTVIEDDDRDGLVDRLIAAARSHVEAYCAVRFAARSAVALKCDCFSDLARLPEAPVQAVASIAYVDVDGAPQTVAAEVYELRADGVEAAIVLKYGQTWPAIRIGSRITVTADLGYATAPEDVRHAMLMAIGFWFENREAASGQAATALPMAVDTLLANHRRGP